MRSERSGFYDALRINNNINIYLNIYTSIVTCN